MKKIFAIVVCAMIATSIYSQKISIAGNIGWMLPGGGGVGSDSLQYDVKGGLSLDGDILYHFDAENPKIGVGVGVHSIILGGAGIITDNYGLQVFGVKGHYRLNPGGFTPYFGATVGLATLSTPEVSVNGQVVNPAEKSSGLGLVLEAGLDINGFLLGVDYILPSKYTIEENGVTLNDGALGGLVISLGYRRGFLED